jgi:hypothetical protein
MKNDDFWIEFKENAERFSTAFRQGRHQRVFDEVNLMLESMGHPFCFDLTERAGICHLIFSPEGNREEAAAIDAFVQSAPAVPGWSITGRRQRKDLGDLRAMLLHLYLIDLDHCNFNLVWMPRPVVTAYIPDHSDLTQDEKGGFANIFLWHALGEEQVMQADIKCNVRTSSPSATGPLLTAAQLIQQCKQKLGIESEAG